MKLRYYMRGLGIGIFVTAILMSVTIDGKTERLTDAEIIQRAEQLGMEQKYESTVLADTVSENDVQPEKTKDVVDGDAKPEDTKPEVTEPEIQPEEIVTDVPEAEEPAEMVRITVQGGDGSQTVAQKLADAGLVADAQAYDKYLCRNGYDKRICTGTHTIPAGAGEEEIAKIITTRP